MASITPYPSGSDILAPLPLYTPDFGMINSLMQKRANMYEQGFQTLKAGFDNIQTAPLSDKANVAIRDNYVKQARENLQKIAASDLSQFQNVEAAQNVFAPFYQDEFLLKDMALNKSAQAEIQKGLSYRDSSDEKMRALYSDDAIEYINRGLTPLQNANRNPEAYARMEQRRFVPVYDIAGDMEKARKEMGYEIVHTDATGPQIVKTTNGIKTVQPYKDFVQANWKQQYDAQMRMQGTLANERAIESKMREGMDEASAKRAVAAEQIGNIKNSYTSNISQAEAMIKQLNDEIKEMGEQELDPATEQEKIAIVNQQLAIKKSTIDSLNSRVSDLKVKLSSYEGDKEATAINSVMNNGSLFFAQLAKNKKIDDIANMFANNYKEEVTNNTAFWEDKKLKLDLEKHDLDIRKVEDQENRTRIMAAKAAGGGAVDLDGDGIAETEVATSSESSTTKVKTDLDKPRVTGLNVYGVTSDVNIFDTFSNFAANTRKQAYDLALSHIEKMKFFMENITSDFFQAFKTADGISPSQKKTAFKDAQFKKLQDAGYIPKDADYDYSTGPTRMVNAVLGKVYDDVAAKVKENKATPEEAQFFVDMNLKVKPQLKSYTELMDKHNKMINDALTNNDYAQLRTGTKGNYKLKDESYIASQAKGLKFVSTGYQFDYGKGTPANLITADQYAKAFKEGKVGPVKLNYIDETHSQYEVEVDGETYAIIGDHSKIAALGRSDKFKEKLDVLAKSVVPKAKYFKDQMGRVGTVVDYTSDGKGETTDKAQLLVEEVFTGNNFVDKDETGGVANMKQLLEAGGYEQEIKDFFNYMIGDIGNNLAKVQYYSIGPDGNPAVNIRIKQEGLAGEKGGKKILSVQSAAAIGRFGINMSIAPGIRLKNAPSLPEAGIANMLMSQKEIVKSTPEMEQAGFKFVIKPTADGSGVNMKIDRKKQIPFKNPDGSMTFKEEWQEGSYQTIPFGLRSPEELINDISNGFVQQYTANAQVVQSIQKANSGSKLPVRQLLQQYYTK